MESHDLALISHAQVHGAYVEALGLVDATHLDDVWFCRTSNPHRLDEWYAFAGAEELLARVNRPNLMLGPRHHEYWRREIRQATT